MSGPISIALKYLIEAGVTNDVMLTAVSEMEAASKPDKSKAAERQARYMARKKASQASLMTVNDDEIPLSPPSPSFSPTPPITTPTTPISDIHNAREASKPSVSRGTRLPADFVPLPATLQLGRNRGLSDERLADELEKFMDWANAATGQVSIKRDWQAAWRNWVKRAAEDWKKSNGKNSTNTIKGGFAVIDAAIENLRQRETYARDSDGQANPHDIRGLLKIAT